MSERGSFGRVRTINRGPSLGGGRSIGGERAFSFMISNGFRAAPSLRGKSVRIGGSTRLPANENQLPFYTVLPSTELPRAESSLRLNPERMQGRVQGTGVYASVEAFSPGSGYDTLPTRELKTLSVTRHLPINEPGRQSIEDGGSTGNISPGQLRSLLGQSNFSGTENISENERPATAVPAEIADTHERMTGPGRTENSYNPAASIVEERKAAIAAELAVTGANAVTLQRPTAEKAPTTASEASRSAKVDTLPKEQPKQTVQLKIMSGDADALLEELEELERKRKKMLANMLWLGSLQNKE